MKKILCLIDALRSGGAERQILGLATLLKEKNYVVDVVTYLPSDFYGSLVEQINGSFLYLDVKPNKINKFLAVRNCVLKGKYDVVIAYKDGATMLSCLLKLSGCHMSLIVSERYTTQFVTLRDKAKFFLYRFADYIVPNSYSQDCFIRKTYPQLSAKLCTITNFTDTDFFTPINSVPNTPLIILTAARIAEQKNIKRYLSAIRHLKDIHVQAKFVWYGCIDEYCYAQECFQMISDLDIADSMEFLPPSDNIIEEYRKCDIVCLPSVFEGYPNVICEAMSCGKPVLCSNICDNPHIVEDGINGYLFDPMDVDDMVNKIQMMCSLDQAQLIEMGKRNRRDALEKFSKETFIRKYIDLIEN